MSAEKVPKSLPETCLACGHLNEEGEHRCEKCGRRLDDPRSSAAAEAPSGSGIRNSRLVGSSAAQERKREGPVGMPIHRRTDNRHQGPAFPEPLRRQLSAQVREFRTRRLRPTLPFPHRDELPQSRKVIPIVVRPAVPSQRQGTSAPYSRSRRSRVAPELQAPLEFPGLASEALVSEGTVSRFDPSLPAVAPIRLRVLGHALDFALILAGLLAFLAPLQLLAGKVVFNRFLLAGGLAAGLVLALLYGVIFLYLAGATPAMRYLGLRLVNFDGRPASRPERLWRFLGAIASAGSFLLGFVWAAVDDERFSWHDHISKTFLTPTTR